MTRLHLTRHRDAREAALQAAAANDRGRPMLDRPHPFSDDVDPADPSRLPPRVTEADLPF